jgi:uncharacterized protein (DUF4213/DUF364 family)
LWELYDRLIESIPLDLYVKNHVIGCSWTCVAAATDNSDNSACCSVGLAHTIRLASVDRLWNKEVDGSRLRDIAALSKSWNLLEASLGVAAINAWWNSLENVSRFAEPAGQDTAGKELCWDQDAFELARTALTGKKVAVIGHFPNIENRLGDICDLCVLERNPDKGDYPDSACEYILPRQDYVFITGMTLTNKTLPRLLQLAGNTARVSLLGPSVPLSPVFFSYGVSVLDGLVITDPRAADARVRGGGHKGIFECGRTVHIAK